MAEEYSPAELARCADALFDAFMDEGKSLQSLQRVLECQRQAVADNDRNAIEESVHGIGRVLLVLEEARRRRQELVIQITGGTEIPLAGIEDALGGVLPGHVMDAWRAVWQAGITLRREVTINKHIIDRTLQIGDQFLQRLFTEGDTAGHYDPGTGSSSSGALMVDRQA